ncbi:MAG TPA: homoserine O-acetyltransferase [Chitinophagaceae bacterium]|nr:homoserine O-acetyltransferase [Chitinophagaceae bacterium]
MQHFHYQHPFTLESGETLPELTIAYHTYGTLKDAKDNVIWICHALTANSNVEEWWPGMIGKGLLFDPQKYFIICANIIGSCYGSTGPLSTNRDTGEPYFIDFPFITMRDVVNAHVLLRKSLGLDRVFLLVGGSIGGYQAMEWSIIEKHAVNNLLLLATSPAESAWGIAVHTAQRMAIEADGTWLKRTAGAAKNGLKAARAIGMLTYRNYEILVQKQKESDVNKTDGFKAASYMKYQGEKLSTRFNAYSYWTLTKTMDSHNIARARADDTATVLSTMDHNTMIIGVSSDILCPVQEQKFMAEHMPNAQFEEIHSAYGHDGFLVETERISAIVDDWLKEN